MGSDASEVQDSTTRSLPIKVHLSMCTQLLRLGDRILNIFPSIEAAQPPPSGIQALCQLQAAIDRARELVQNCRASSKLYLAITGETVKLRFEKARNVLDQNLSQLRSMVPVALELEISAILYDLRATDFIIDSHEELAGKALRGILQRDESPIDSVGDSELELLLFAAPLLHITSNTDLLIEKRCLRRLLEEVKEETSTKRKTLKYLYYLLKKYATFIVGTQARNSSYDKAHISAKLESKHTTKSSGQDFRKGPISYFRGRIPPEEFVCALSSRLMVDPVIISSGQTFEKIYIEKWFQDGHDTCPRTSEKLHDLSIRPNTAMRNLISKWSLEQGDEISDRSIGASFYGSLETSSNSMHSTASSMKGIDLRIDASNLSIGSLDSSYGNFSYVRTEHSFGAIKESSDVEPPKFQFYPSIEDIRKKFLSNVRELPWESQVAAIQDVNTYLTDYNPSCSFVSSENFLEPLFSFLQEAVDKHDGKSQKAGSQLFLTFLQASRREPVHINEHVYTLLASLLATEAAGETLDIIEALSTQVTFSNFTASSAILASIFKILGSDNKKFQASALRILQKISSKLDSSFKLASEWISVLVPFLEDNSIAGTCLSILENLYRFEDIRLSDMTQTLIAQIIKLLDKFDCKDQEHAVDMILSLCTQNDYFCQLVLHEGGIPPLNYVLSNGSNKAKASSSELLRQLRETTFPEDVQENPIINDATPENRQVVNSDQKSSKGSGFKKWLFRKK